MKKQLFFTKYRYSRALSNCLWRLWFKFNCFS